MHEYSNGSIHNGTDDVTTLPYTDWRMNSLIIKKWREREQSSADGKSRFDWSEFRTEELRAEWFTDLASLGFSLVPMGGGDDGKIPSASWTHLQKKSNSNREINAWWGERGRAREHNVGIITGRRLGLYVVDADSEESVKHVDGLLTQQPGLTVVTGRGEHRYYAYPSDEDCLAFNGNRKRDGDAWFGQRIGGHTPTEDGSIPRKYDLKADGNYVIAPGSIHRSTGRVYSVKDGTPADYLEFLLGGAAPRLSLGDFDSDCFCGAAQGHSEKCRREKGLRREVSLPTGGTGSHLNSLAAPPSRRSPFTAPRVKDSYGQAEFRASRYMERVEPAVQGSAGDLTTYKAACSLVRGFDLSDESAYQILAEWNQRCSPPWTEASLRSKIASARRSGSGEFGYLLNAVREDTLSVTFSPKRDASENGVPSYTREDRKNLRWLCETQIDEDDISVQRKVTRLAYCGVANALTSCSEVDTHTDLRVGKVVCEDTKRCPYCAGQHGRVQSSFIAKEWLCGDVAVLRVPLDADGMRDAPAETSRESRREVRKALWAACKERGGGRPDYRWVVGHQEWAFIMPVYQGGDEYLQPGEDEGLGELSIISPSEAGALVAEIWQQPAQYLQGLLRQESIMDIVEFADSPYMTIGEGHYPRTAASKVSEGEEHVLPWPSLERIREELIEKALERRGGVPLNQCSHWCDEKNDHCRAPVKKTFIDSQTGQLLTSGIGSDWRTTQRAIQAVSALHESELRDESLYHAEAVTTRGP